MFLSIDLADNKRKSKNRKETLMDIKKLLGKRLKEIRKYRKITQEQVAEYVGIETPSISHIENGKYFPTAENLDKILKILDVRPSDIFTFENLSDKNELIKEMLESMQKDEQLTKMMYKFYMAVKY